MIRLPRRTAYAATAALAGTLALGGCGSSSGSGSDSDSEPGARPELKPSGAYMPQPVMNDMAGGFMVIENKGDEDDKLTSVTTDIAKTVEMHKTVDQQMQQVKSFPVPADGELALSRGGNHLMFLDLKRKPAEGDKVTVKLHFEKSDPITVSVPVKATNYTPAK
nr:copper chaperone PCu(A)C [Streptomyces armeniacus]